MPFPMGLRLLDKFLPRKVLPNKSRNIYLTKVETCEKRFNYPTNGRRHAIFRTLYCPVCGG